MRNLGHLAEVIGDAGLAYRETAHDMPRSQRAQLLIEFFVQNLAEDPQDGTQFDVDVLDALEGVRNRYAQAESQIQADTEA